MSTKTILEDAQGLVYGDRQASYGHPREDFERTAKMWSAILGVEVTAEKVAMCMVAVKLSRLCHAYKRDSVVDIAGYAATMELLDAVGTDGGKATSSVTDFPRRAHPPDGGL